MDNEFNLKDFLIKVDAYTDDWKGEFEVSEKALESYLTYQCYNSEGGWKFPPNQKDDGMLYNAKDSIFLTADIITSIKTPVNKILGAKGKTKFKGKGAELRNIILCDAEYLDKNGLNCGWKAFARVYYWIGNMMPVIINFSTGYGNDNWNWKVDFFKKCYQPLDNCDYILNRQERTFRAWIKAMEKYVENFDDFIEKNYLIDFVDENSNVKNGQEINEENEASWIIENTKIIIQRSYRIRYKKLDEFDKTDKDNINCIFKEVFDIGKDIDLSLF